MNDSEQDQLFSLAGAIEYYDIFGKSFANDIALCHVGDDTVIAAYIVLRQEWHRAN